MAKTKTKTEPAAEVAAEALTVVEQANALVVTNDAEFEAAADFLTGTLKPMLTEIDSTFGPIVSAAHEAHKTALRKKKEVREPVELAERVVKQMIGAYSTEQERKAAEAKAQAEREAREAAEQAQLDAAAELEAEGRNVEAEIVLRREPVAVAPPPSSPPPAKPKADGVQVKKRWQFRVTDPAKIKPEFLKVDTAKVRKAVTSFGDEAPKFVGDGIEVWQETDVAASSR